MPGLIFLWEVGRSGALVDPRVNRSNEPRILEVHSKARPPPTSKALLIG